MKKIIALMVAALALAGCSNFVTDFGIPSVRFSTKSFGSTPTGYIIELEIQPYLGSPSGQISRILLSAPPSQLTSLSVPECLPPTEADNCPKIPYTLNFAANPGSLAITGYEAVSLNGTTRTVTLPAPHVINP